MQQPTQKIKKNLLSLLGDHGFEPHSGLQVSKKQNVSSSLTRKDSILWDFESCVWRAVSSHLSHHPQDLLLAQFSLYVRKGGLKPHSFYFLLSSLSSHIYQYTAIIYISTLINAGGGLGQCWPSTASTLAQRYSLITDE